MIEHESNAVRAVAWMEIFQWLNIVRIFRMSIAPKVLLLGAAGVLLTSLGWWFTGTCFGVDRPATEWLEPFQKCPWKAVTEVIGDQPSLPGDWDWPRGTNLESHWSPGNPVSGPWELLNAPMVQGLSHAGVSVRESLAILLSGVLAVAVWAFFGLAICRIVAVWWAAGERVGLVESLLFAGRKWLSCMAAPLLPVAGILLLALGVAALGLLIRLLGLWIGGLLWPFALAAAALAALLLLGLLFGWPLMWATIGIEGTDGFDAISRSYAYTFQRPLHYLCYAFAAGFVGWLGWLLVKNFAAGVVWLGYWSASFGCSEEQLKTLLGDGGGFGAGLTHFWAGCVKLLGVGYLFGYFFSASAAVYFLLRRDVDNTPMDEIYLESTEEPEAAMPSIATDAAGAPKVDDEPAAE